MRGFETLRELLTQCRNRVLTLAAPADKLNVDIQVHNVLDQWQLMHPTIHLKHNEDAPLQLMLEPGVGHLIMVLLNNAADAGERSNRRQVDLNLHIQDGQLYGEVRDYGSGFETPQGLLPGMLFHTQKQIAWALVWHCPMRPSNVCKATSGCNPPKDAAHE